MKILMIEITEVTAGAREESGSLTCDDREANSTSRRPAGTTSRRMRRRDRRTPRPAAIAGGVHSVWTNVRRIMERVTNGRSRGHTPTPDGKRSPMASGRASVADAFRRDVVRLRRLVRTSVLEPYARRRRRKIAVDQLRALDDRLLADIGLLRGDIQLAVDGGLPTRHDVLPTPIERPLLPMDDRREPAKAA